MAAHSHWSLHVDAGRIAWLTCDCAGATTNVLSEPVLMQFGAHLESLRTQSIEGLIIGSAKPDGFIAGADIKAFSTIGTAEAAYPLVRAGQAVLQQLEDLPFPSVAALHGFVLGGGLELALACSYRLGADEPGLALGLPEVLLGIHPGFGGTVRSVRLIGVRAAWELMLTGKPFKAQRALRAGLIDALVTRAELPQRARELVLTRPPQRRASLSQRALGSSVLRPLIAKQAAAALALRVRQQHYPAPFAIVELWRRHGARGEAAFDAESRSISGLICTPTSRNLVRVFFLQERLKSLGAASSKVFRHVHVIGAGVMGGDIAAWCAYRGMSVTLQDRTEALVVAALDRAKAFFEKRIKDPGSAAQALARLHVDVHGAGVAGADLVLEAIVENVEAKLALYARLEAQLKPDAVLASNTSSIDIDTLAAQLKDPGRLVGIHFFNPVAQLPLVEIVRGSATRDGVFADSLHFTRALEKLPLPCKSAPGFLVNRILAPYVNEALLALEGGVPAALIDQTAVRFGMPMGPIELTDVVGLDVSMHVGAILSAGTRRVPQVLVDLVKRGKLGRKSGEGFYVWHDGKPQKPAFTEPDAASDLEDRMILALLNEAVGCLHEGIVNDADLLDAGAVFATGFAPFRGGPLQYAKDRGILAVTRRLDQLAEQYGERFRPAPGWDRIRSLC